MAWETCNQGKDLGDLAPRRRPWVQFPSPCQKSPLCGSLYIAPSIGIIIPRIKVCYFVFRTTRKGAGVPSWLLRPAPHLMADKYMPPLRLIYIFCLTNIYLQFDKYILSCSLVVLLLLVRFAKQAPLWHNFGHTAGN